jgi:hypothetical protein
MRVAANTLTANEQCPGKQQSVSFSGCRMNQFTQDLFPELNYVPCFRLAELLPLTLMAARSPAQYQGQQQPPCTTANGEPMPDVFKNNQMAVGAGCHSNPTN